MVSNMFSGIAEEVGKKKRFHSPRFTLCNPQNSGKENLPRHETWRQYCSKRQAEDNFYREIVRMYMKKGYGW